jgi:hypothetical protein
VRALGYDMNTVEFAIRDGVPYAIDFMNPAPDMDINSLLPHYFKWCVTHMADMAIDLAHNPRPQLSEMRWHELFCRGDESEQEGCGGISSLCPLTPCTSATHLHRSNHVSF